MWMHDNCQWKSSPLRAKLFVKISINAIMYFKQIYFNQLVRLED